MTLPTDVKVEERIEFAIKELEALQTDCSTAKWVRDSVLAVLSGQIEPPCERCGGSGCFTIYDTATHIGQQCSPIGDEPCPACSSHEPSEDLRSFKNFHRLLCERFGYVHDEKDWQRDQLSLIEHIANRNSGYVLGKTPTDLSDCELADCLRVAAIEASRRLPAVTK